MEAVDLGLAGFVLTAIGWISREIWRWRKARRLATEDATKTWNQKKTLLEEMISKAENINDKDNLIAQRDEVDAALLGLYGERIRHTLKEAGLPPEEKLIADGRTQLQPQQVARLEQVVSEVKALPQFVSTQDLLALGNAYYYAEQYQDAKDTYDKLLSLNPDDPVTLNNRGNTYAKLERYDEALADYNRSLELSPDDPDTLNNRGVTYGYLGRRDEALADFNRSLELRPDDPDILYNLACLFSLWGKTGDAVAYLEKAIEKDKKYREKARTDKDFDNIRDDPRFKKLIEPD